MTTARNVPAAVETVVDNFNRILAADNGQLSFVRRDGGTVILRYLEGKNEECPTCVFTPEDLTALVLEATQKRDASIESVKLV
jgi:Fe-S cluster biogenesis protein NfuA